MLRSFLITGGCGFIGSHVVERLLGLGKTVRVFDNAIPGKMAYSPMIHADGIEYLEGDIQDYHDCRLAVRGMDAVIHMAALINVDHSNRSPRPHFETNLIGTLELLEAIRNGGGVKKLVYISTAEIYGEVPEPHKATERGIMDVDPTSPYAASKFAAERACMAYYHTYKEPEVTAVRPFNTFGPRQTAGGMGALHAIFIVNALRGKPLQVYGTGEQRRDYVFVEDLARGIVAAALRRGIGGEVINLASGETVSVNTVAEKVRSLVGPVDVIHEDARPNENMRSCGDAGKAGMLLGWKAKTPYDFGLGRTVDWYRENLDKFSIGS